MSGKTADLTCGFLMISIISLSLHRKFFLKGRAK